MSSKLEYQWIPRKEIDLYSVERMKSHFQKPSEPMGESWFMSEERRMYYELMEYPVEEISIKLLSKILTEISLGISCFGHRTEWDEWFKYLLPYLILRSHEEIGYKEFLIQDVVTAFMSVYWIEIFDEYVGFRDDVINSLSISLMINDLWTDFYDENAEKWYPKFTFQADVARNGKLCMNWGVGNANNNLSAIMFFCLKYLKPNEIFSWLHSCIQICDPFWKGNLMIWLLGIYDLLHEPIIVPSQIEVTMPKLTWSWSHVLGSDTGSIDVKYPPMDGYNDNKDFLPSKNVRAFREAISQYITGELIVEWADLFSRDPFLAEGTYSIPERLLEKLESV